MPSSYSILILNPFVIIHSHSLYEEFIAVMFKIQIVFMKKKYCFNLQYFNYMGMLAVEGTYDKMEALLSQNIHPVDILLMMAASEGDQPKIEELLRAGASYTVKDADGRTALERAANDEIKDLILNFSTQKA